MSNKSAHIPVLLEEVIHYLKPKKGGIYVDGTFGAGGYSRAVLQKTEAQIYGIDRDPEISPFAEKLRAEYPPILSF